MTASRKLHCIRKQVLEDLLKTFRIALDVPRQRIRKFHIERQVLRLCDMPECAIDGLSQTNKRKVFNFDRNRARLDLGQIQDIVDEIEQVRARRVDVPGEFDLPVRQGSRTVFCELLAQNKDGIERCSQLM